jgi:hypothetical protein
MSEIFKRIEPVSKVLLPIDRASVIRDVLE